MFEIGISEIMFEIGISELNVLQFKDDYIIKP